MRESCRCPDRPSATWRVADRARRDRSCVRGRVVGGRRGLERSGLPSDQRQVSVDGTTRPLPGPFLAIATQNAQGWLRGECRRIRRGRERFGSSTARPEFRRVVGRVARPVPTHAGDRGWLSDGGRWLVEACGDGVLRGSIVGGAGARVIGRGRSGVAER